MSAYRAAIQNVTQIMGYLLPEPNNDEIVNKNAKAMDYVLDAFTESGTDYEEKQQLIKALTRVVEIAAAQVSEAAN